MYCTRVHGRLASESHVVTKLVITKIVIIKVVVTKVVLTKIVYNKDCYWKGIIVSVIVK